MIKNNLTTLYAIVAQLLGLSRKPSGILSDSGRGPVEKTGKVIAVKRTVRGISLELDSGLKASWILPAYTADDVMSMIAERTITIGIGQLSVRSEDGRTIGDIMGEMVDDGYCTERSEYGHCHYTFCDDVTITRG